jgi:16S rRNA (guanine527-N7)-methyltransferase
MTIIQKYFPELTETQIAQFKALQGLYADWNEKINVISRKDIDELYLRHVLHSLGIAKIIKFRPDTHILDVGTGGGFPGIPLAILFPESKFHLVDSIGKKIKVVQAVADDLNLKNVTASHARVETIKAQYDFIVSRAVTNMPKFVNWVKSKIKAQDQNSLPNGILYLKGGDLSEELRPFPEAEITNLKDYFSESFFETKHVVYLQV